MVFSPVTEGAVRIQSQLDYGRLRILPGKDASTEIFALGYFDDARFGLEAYADAIAKVYAIKLHAAARWLLHLVHGEKRRIQRRKAFGRTIGLRRKEPQTVRIRFHPDRRRMAGRHRG